MAAERRIDREVELQKIRVTANHVNEVTARVAKYIMYGLVALDSAVGLGAFSYSLAEGQSIATDVVVFGLGALIVAAPWVGKGVAENLEHHFKQATATEQTELERLQGLQNL